MKQYKTPESQRKYQKKRYEENKEERKSYQRDYYEKKREECLIRYKKWSMTHDRSEYQKEYYKRRKQHECSGHERDLQNEAI